MLRDDFEYFEILQRTKFSTAINCIGTALHIGKATSKIAMVRANRVSSDSLFVTIVTSLSIL